MQTDVETQFDSYSSLFVKKDLEKVNPCLSISNEEKTTLKSLYESGSDETSNLWKELEKRNGGRKIICPICGHGFASELDHYIPREKYPEFSLHLWNLIPLCHYCNYNKGTLWLDDKGNRLIFNAYYDVPTSIDYWKVNVIIQNNVPYVTVDVNTPLLNAANNTIEKAQSTNCNSVLFMRILLMQILRSQ